jgi:hypothetical protein
MGLIGVYLVLALVTSETENTNLCVLAVGATTGGPEGCAERIFGEYTQRVSERRQRAYDRHV